MPDRALDTSIRRLGRHESEGCGDRREQTVARQSLLKRLLGSLSLLYPLHRPSAQASGIYVQTLSAEELFIVSEREWASNARDQQKTARTADCNKVYRTQ